MKPTPAIATAVKHLLTIADISVECLPEETQIEGNASAVDADTDRETESWIYTELNRGNTWAWCAIRVTVEWEGFTGRDVLGCCSYRRERDFLECGYYADMCETAAREVAESLNERDLKRLSGAYAAHRRAELSRKAYKRAQKVAQKGNGV